MNPMKTACVKLLYASAYAADHDAERGRIEARLPRNSCIYVDVTGPTGVLRFNEAAGIDAMIQHLTALKASVESYRAGQQERAA